MGVKKDRIFFVWKILWEWKMIEKCKTMKTLNCLQIFESVESQYRVKPDDHFRSPVYVVWLKMCYLGALGPFPAAHVFGAASVKNPLTNNELEAPKRWMLPVCDVP
jgi:hypothetical protein